MIDRFYAPYYGPDLTTTPVQSSDEIWSGFGFGLGGMEHFACDHIEKYLCGQSELGYLSLIDYSSFPATATPYSLDLTEFQSDVKDVAVCPEQGLMFVSLNEMDKVNMDSTVKRGSPSKPVLLSAIDAGHLPDILKLSPDCYVLAVANENEEDALNQGRVAFVSNPKGPDGPSMMTLAFNGFTDACLLDRNVHMPLTEKAMQHWDDFSNISDDSDWASIRAVYNPALLFLEPENFAFSDDGKVLYVNLQENSALLRVDIESASAKAVDGYGLKAWTSRNGIDIVEDDGCSLFATNPAIYSNRAPDGIASVDIDGVNYILTADEGDDKSYGNYDEKATPEIFQWRHSRSLHQLPRVQVSRVPKKLPVRLIQRVSCSYLRSNLPLAKLLVFAGALSSTLSFWEFECAQPAPALTPTVGAPASSIAAAAPPTTGGFPLVPLSAQPLE